MPVIAIASSIQPSSQLKSSCELENPHRAAASAHAEDVPRSSPPPIDGLAEVAPRASMACRVATHAGVEQVQAGADLAGSVPEIVESWSGLLEELKSQLGPDCGNDIVAGQFAIDTFPIYRSETGGLTIKAPAGGIDEPAPQGVIFAAPSTANFIDIDHEIGIAFDTGNPVVLFAAEQELANLMVPDLVGDSDELSTITRYLAVGDEPPEFSSQFSRSEFLADVSKPTSEQTSIVTFWNDVRAQLDTLLPPDFCEGYESEFREQAFAIHNDSNGAPRLEAATDTTSHRDGVVFASAWRHAWNDGAEERDIAQRTGKPVVFFCAATGSGFVAAVANGQDHATIYSMLEQADPSVAA